MNNNCNTDILKKIIKYCMEIDEANKDFGNSIEMLKMKSTYKNAVAMCILQIGELVAHLVQMILKQLILICLGRTSRE